MTMKVHYGYEELNLKDPVITMGIFDGVHRGHCLLIERVVNEARRCGSEAVVVTFDPHPRIVLDDNPEKLRFLTDIDERIYLLGKMDIDHLVIIPFTRELSNLTACEFIENILCKKLKVSHLVAGFNHHFGKRHEGTGETIAECSQKFGFNLTRADALSEGGIIISSSVIRGLLNEGKVEDAERLLGYPYFVTGKVVTGQKIGRNLGFPTANIEPSFRHKLIPSRGVYAVEVQICDSCEKLMAMVNIGNRPTITGGQGADTIEAHLINFSGDLYGREIRIIFRYRLRDEKKFGSVDDLVNQINADMKRTVLLLG
ncbi:MAG TPA: bifunctional riboflavin kinase/FAD synthetase [Bacteroidales bacterium]|nr:bifunctional riboflavin kinase/FAD synthetase [Bacteroidales bacterium]